jgi:hypothetical protein
MQQSRTIEKAAAATAFYRGQIPPHPAFGPPLPHGEGKHNKAGESFRFPLSPPPEHGGRLAIKADKCLSAASFCPPAKRLPCAGNPRSGPGDGVPFLAYFFPARKRSRASSGAQPPELGRSRPTGTFRGTGTCGASPGHPQRRAPTEGCPYINANFWRYAARISLSSSG